MNVEGDEIDLFLWDTASQERYQGLMPQYARGSSVAILTTSITDARSFQSIDKWIAVLEDANERIPPIVLAVNKVDLKAQGTRSVEELAVEFGDRFHAMFFVSALTGEQVENLFQFVALSGWRFASAVEMTTRTLVPAERKACC
jgi:small GTP-binding protein